MSGHTHTPLRALSAHTHTHLVWVCIQLFIPVKDSDQTDLFRGRLHLWTSSFRSSSKLTADGLEPWALACFTSRSVCFWWESRERERVPRKQRFQKVSLKFYKKLWFLLLGEEEATKRVNQTVKLFDTTFYSNPPEFQIIYVYRWISIMSQSSFFCQ